MLEHAAQFDGGEVTINQDSALAKTLQGVVLELPDLKATLHIDSDKIDDKAQFIVRQSLHTKTGQWCVDIWQREQGNANEWKHIARDLVQTIQ